MKGKQSMKELINRLISWLEKHGLSEKEILECLTFITGK